MSQTLADALPWVFAHGGEYADCAAFRLRNSKVVRRFDGIAWPGPHKNVHHFFLLDTYDLVGFNENLQRGLTFPVLPCRPLKEGGTPQDWSMIRCRGKLLRFNDTTAEWT